MKAPAVIEFDNLTADLRPFDKLCSALTSESLEGRQLGHSRTLVVPTRTLFLSSGNNVRPIEDMVRRCISIHLDPGMETPAARIYKRPNLLDEVRRDRIKFIGAALTIVRAWVLAGQPSTRCPSLASYSEWSNWCRQPLLWLAQPDPAASVFKGLKEDPSHLLLGRVLAGWHEKHGSGPRMIRDVVKAAVLGVAQCAIGLRLALLLALDPKHDLALFVAQRALDGDGVVAERLVVEDAADGRAVVCMCLYEVAKQTGDAVDVRVAHLPALRPQALAHLLPHAAGVNQLELALARNGFAVADHPDVGADTL